ncbi:MAG: carboxypeptidase regulatory-like domain-containing protein, partial [Terracidiphilus sp.]
MAGVLAQAAPVSGTVTDKTTGKPAAGDQVVMLDVQAGMSEVAHATTDAKGHYSLNGPGDGPYLVRVTHQGAGYFIAAPPGGGSGDIPVYDVAAKVQGVRIEADVIEAETDNGQLKVNERYFVHNTSVPPITQWSPKSFEVVLPPGAVLAGAGAQRPGGLPTSVNLDPAGEKGHYAFNFPIQPDDGEKDTM